MRRSAVRCLTIHSPRAVPFKVSKDEALKQLADKYDNGWFTTPAKYINFNSISAEFVPFFLCAGTVNAIYKATIKYRHTSTDSKGQTRTYTTTSYVGPTKYGTSFEENNAQVYAAYKFTNRHIMATIAGPDLSTNMVRVKNMDMSEGKINMFEMSTTTLRGVIERELRSRAKEECTAAVKAGHWGASEINIQFDYFHVKMDHVTPVYAPTYVVQASYDTIDYTMFVNGYNGTPGGPYLLSAVTFGRVAAGSAFALVFLTAPNKVYGLAMGTVLGVLAYYAGFYGARQYPKWRRDRLNASQSADRDAHQDDDAAGYKPDVDSARTDDDEFLRKSKETLEQEYERSKQKASKMDSRTQRMAADPKGYYATLHVDPNASINEIRAAYRNQVLTNHPDTGGSESRMVKINEAYRVLRDEKRRAEYDATRA